MSNPEPDTEPTTPADVDPRDLRQVCQMCPYPEDHDIHAGPADTEGLHLWEPITVPAEACGLCGGMPSHPVHNGEEVQGVEPHDIVPMSEMLRRVNAQLSDLTNENLARSKKLARGEPPMQLDAASMSALRFETLLNHVLPPGSLDRLRFEHYFQGEVSNALDNAFSEQAKRRLGVQPTSRTGLTIPGRG